MIARPAAGALLISALMPVPSAEAQTWVGSNIEGGMHWHVAASQGASWRLQCRFPPVTYYRSAYEQRAWINRLDRSGQGEDAGRLPLNVGDCTVWKTGGRGAVAIAISRGGETRADATLDPATPAAVFFL